MKQTALFILSIIATFSLLFTACGDLDEHYSTNPNYRLSFSVDTLSFDTVFTTIGSATKQFMIYNQNSEALNIESIMLASGGESGFRLNVDGRKGDYFDNVGILAEDSMFVFVEVNIDPNDSNQPLLVEDSVVFITNGISQSVRLEAYGQNMCLHKGGLHITRDTTWTADLPHLVYDSITVDAGATLYLSLDDTYLDHLEELCSAGILGRIEQPGRIAVEGEAFRFEFPVKVRRRMVAEGATVLARDADGDPVFFRSNFGRGKVFTCAYPLERIAMENAGLFDSEMFRIYAAVVVKRPLLNVGECRITVTEHFFSENRALCVIVNGSGEELEVHVETAPGWHPGATYSDLAEARLTGGRLLLPPCAGTGVGTVAGPSFVRQILHSGANGAKNI